jgi:hypothetical protein
MLYQVPIFEKICSPKIANTCSSKKGMFISSEYFQRTVHRCTGIGLDLDHPQGTSWVDFQTGVGIACQKEFDLVPRKKPAINVITWSNIILPGV